MEDDVNLLPDDCEDLALEEEDLNFQEDRHEESLLSTETGKETNPEAEAAAGIQSPGDAVSGHGMRNASSSKPHWSMEQIVDVVAPILLRLLVTTYEPQFLQELQNQRTHTWPEA
ncbi:hypothetical protein Dimus_020387 [Dionaea muscipula]